MQSTKLKFLPNLKRKLSDHKFIQIMRKWKR